MAMVAPREGGDRNTTGTRTDPVRRIERGSVVLAGDCYAIAWHPLASAWLALPFALQHGPLHRSHVILEAHNVPLFDVPRGRLLVETGKPVLITVDAPVLGRLQPELIDRIALTLRRAAEAHAIEAGLG